MHLSYSYLVDIVFNELHVVYDCYSHRELKMCLIMVSMNHLVTVDLASSWMRKELLGIIHNDNHQQN
jgi:hypothetical protein